MAKPTKLQQSVINIRNEQIMEMVNRGYPRNYICDYFGLKRSRLSIIIKNLRKEEELEIKKIKVEQEKSKITGNNFKTK